MDIITEYDFVVQRRLLLKQRDLVDIILKNLCKHLCQPDSKYNHATCFGHEFILLMEACNRFTVYLPVILHQESSIHVHNHSPCCVLLQNSGSVSEFMKGFINRERFLRSDGIKTVLNIHLRRAFDAYMHGKSQKRVRREHGYSALYLTYTNILRVISDYGVINIEILPAIRVQNSLKSWFSRGYTCSPSYFLAKCSPANKFPSPDLIWTLSFLDQEREIEHKHQRLFAMALVFIDKFELKVIQREEVLQTLFRLENNDNGMSKSLLDVLSFLDSTLSSKCMYNIFVKERANMLQFENEVEIIKASNTVHRYLRRLQSYYSS